jgi:hypothetical protein
MTTLTQLAERWLPSGQVLSAIAWSPERTRWIYVIKHRGALLATRARHSTAMLELFETASRSLWGPDEQKWVNQIDEERADG